jgi:hypothetical protein
MFIFLRIILGSKHFKERFILKTLLILDDKSDHMIFFSIRTLDNRLNSPNRSTFLGKFIYLLDYIFS